MSYLNLATHQVLLRSYEELAILHNRKNKPENSKLTDDRFSESYLKVFCKEEKIIDNYVYKLTKITKHAKRHFWLNDVCTCHGLLPSHSA